MSYILALFGFWFTWILVLDRYWFSFTCLAANIMSDLNTFEVTEDSVEDVSIRFLYLHLIWPMWNWVAITKKLPLSFLFHSICLICSFSFSLTLIKKSNMLNNFMLFKAMYLYMYASIFIGFLDAISAGFW